MPLLVKRVKSIKSKKQTFLLHTPGNKRYIARIEHIFTLLLSLPSPFSYALFDHYCALTFHEKYCSQRAQSAALYLTIHLCVSRIINNICLTPLLLSPSVCNLHYNKNAFFYLSLLAMCAPKMPNRNEKKGEAV